MFLEAFVFNAGTEANADYYSRFSSHNSEISDLQIDHCGKINPHDQDARTNLRPFWVKLKTPEMKIDIQETFISVI